MKNWINKPSLNQVKRNHNLKAIIRICGVFGGVGIILLIHHEICYVILFYSNHPCEIISTPSLLSLISQFFTKKKWSLHRVTYFKISPEQPVLVRKQGYLQRCLSCDIEISMKSPSLACEILNIKNVIMALAPWPV